MSLIESLYAQAMCDFGQRWWGNYVHLYIQLHNVVDDLIDSPAVKLDLTTADSDLANRFVALVCM